MSKIRELTCIGCPIGCALSVEIDDGNVIKVTGNHCKRGEIYGQKECTNPTRIVTSTVCVVGGEIDAVSVKTENDIPKDKIFEIVSALNGVRVNAPVNEGNTIVENIANTGVNVIATKNVLAK